MRIPLAAAMILLSTGNALGDCRWIDRPTADRALSMLRDSPMAVLGDRLGSGSVPYIEPEPVPRIGLVAAPSYTESWSGGPWYGLVAHGGREIKIQQVYIQTADGAYVNLSRQLGCEDSGAPESLPGTPPVRQADRSGRSVSDIPGRSFIGLVGLPGISWMTPEADRQPIPLYSAPDVSAPALATIGDWNALPHDEMGYEESAALVIEENRGWYRIGVIDGPLPPDAGNDVRWALHWYRFLSGASAWIAPEDAGEFKPYEDLVTDALTYLDNRWDGLLSAEPEPAAAVWSLAPDWSRNFHRPDQIDVAVRETRWVGGRLWVRVTVLWPGECAGVPPLRIAEGWVPGHTSDGAPVVQYYSRGC